MSDVVLMVLTPSPVPPAPPRHRPLLILLGAVIVAGSLAAAGFVLLVILVATSPTGHLGLETTQDKLVFTGIGAIVMLVLAASAAGGAALGLKGLRPDRRAQRPQG